MNVLQRFSSRCDNSCWKQTVSCDKQLLAWLHNLWWQQIWMHCCQKTRNMKQSRLCVRHTSETKRTWHMTFMCKRWTQQQLVGKIISNPQKCQERLLAFNKWVFFNACWLWHDAYTSTRWSNFNFKIGILAPNTSSNVSNLLKHVLWPQQVIAEPHGTHTHTHTHTHTPFNGSTVSCDHF